MKRSLLLSLSASLLLSSCLMGPDFKGATAPDLPVTWVNALPPASRESDLCQWWASFGDPQLDALIRRAFQANPDMISAALAISRAESQLRQSKSDLFPTAGLNASGNNAGSYDSPTSHGTWNGSLSASWTPDIWGGSRREAEAAEASLGSAKAAAAATRTALAASIATTYFEWISAKESLRIANEQLAYQQRSFDITAKRDSVGFAAKLDLAEARSVIASTRAQIPSYEAAIKNCENTLATYLGCTLAELRLHMPSAEVYNRIPSVPTGLPSEMLRRRPDIVRAEYELHAATARIGVSTADLFPKLSLSGNTGSRAGTDFAGFWQSSTWSLGASVSQSLFNRVNLNENLRQAKLSEKSSYQSYRKTVLAAFAEVEERLIAYARLESQLPEFAAASAANREAAELALTRFNAGESDYLNVATSQRALLSSELNLISTRQDIRIQLARLCTALGGGWNGERQEN